jgi:predicted GNAT superfamily acetyltransferase
MIIRALHTIPEFRQVIALEQEIWGYSDAEDAVGIPMFVITVKRGGILLGAYDGDRLIGFVYSIAGLKDGRPMQWSHMLGVLPAYRATGIGRALKREQRHISLEMGLDLMEWTCDPLVAVNAYLNFRRLGVIVEEYALNVYGDSSSPLHRGAPTDRFIAQWQMRSPRVVRMLEADGVPSATRELPSTALPPTALRTGRAGHPPGYDSRRVANPEPPIPGVPVVNTVERRGDGLACTGHDLTRTDPELGVSIPSDFNEMLERRPDRARAWRMASREIFIHYFSKGYRVVDFSFVPGGDEGRYLLRLDNSGHRVEPDSRM